MRWSRLARDSQRTERCGAIPREALFEAAEHEGPCGGAAIKISRGLVSAPIFRLVLQVKLSKRRDFSAGYPASGSSLEPPRE